jgi:hypothetical protein
LTSARLRPLRVRPLSPHEADPRLPRSRRMVVGVIEPNMYEFAEIRTRNLAKPSTLIRLKLPLTGWVLWEKAVATSDMPASTSISNSLGLVFRGADHARNRVRRYAYSTRDEEGER